MDLMMHCESTVTVIKLASYADVLRLVTRGGTRDKPKNVCMGGYDQMPTREN